MISVRGREPVWCMIALLAGGAAQLMLGCATDGSPTRLVRAATDEQKQATIERVKAMKGTWNIADSKGETEGQSVFSIGGAGSTVREVMFPGSGHEMTNMYHMDGPSIVCTHYCAEGNQPQMRATASGGNTLRFTLDHVSNLRAPDEKYMGEMWLTFKDDNTVEQRWRCYQSGEICEDFTFTLTRVH